VFDVPIERYPQYLLCGLLPWVFISQTLTRSTASISTEPDLLRKAPFPYELMPMSAVTAQAFNFLITLFIFVAYLGVAGELRWATLPALAFPVLAVFLLVASLSLVLALVDVYNHDLRHVLGNVLTIWFFLVPILYRPQMTPESVEFLQSIEPVSLIVTQFRAVLYRGTVGHVDDLMLMFVICIAVLVVCLAGFRRFSHQLPKDI
jgi:lipopolysaccharide transport system permease protein